MASLVGKSLGRYHILEQLGEGGMAVVYKALDTHLQRYVAIKVILPQRQLSPDALKRFEREARALAQLSHPNILKILDYGEHNQLPFLVMEYQPGGTLKQYLERHAGKPIHWQHAAGLLVSVASALETAHQQNIIHRDVKPSNVLLTQGGQPMLSDFGIAKILDSEETADLTASGVGIGTPQYMAPEQGLGRADARSDIYSLGTIFYEMVTGRTPYKADTPMAVMLKKSTEPLPRPKRFVPDLPDAVETLLFTALHRDPAHRHQSMSDFRIALENLRDGKLQTPKTPRAALPIAAWWAFGIAGVCIGLAIIAGLIMTVSPRRPSSGGLDDAPPSFTPASTVILPTQPPPQLILPTETPPPTETPFPTPTTDSLLSLRREVETFIIDYWNLVSNKDFQTAYRYLSADFKERNHPNGVEGFRNGFKYTSSVRVLTADAVSVDSSFAIVDAELQFVTTDGNSFTVYHRYMLIRENGRWVIDSAKKK